MAVLCLVTKISLTGVAREASSHCQHTERLMITCVHGRKLDWEGIGLRRVLRSLLEQWLEVWRTAWSIDWEGLSSLIAVATVMLLFAAGTE